MNRPVPFDREPSGTIVLRDGKIVFATVGIAALTERSNAALLGATYLDLIVPEDRERIADRYLRRLRGEPVPGEYETAILLPDGRRRTVEIRADLDGADVVVRVRDVSVQAARRPRLTALAALGAAIQRERSEADVFARVREGLWGLGLASALVRAEKEGVRVEWTRLPDPAASAVETRLGTPLEGFRGRWSGFARSVWESGSAYTDDWGTEVSHVLPDAHASDARALAVSLGLSHAIGVRLDQRAAARYYLVVVGDWLQRGDVAPLQLFGAQVAAALDGARIVADVSRRNAELSALNRLGELAGEAGGLDVFFRRAAEVLRGATGLTALTVFTLDEGAGELTAAYQDGTGAEEAARLARVRMDGTVGGVVRDRAARLLSGSDALDGARLSDFGHDAVALVPLVARSRAVGVLAAAFTGAPERVQHQLEFLAASAAHVASAIESHGLLSDLRRRVGELTLLNDLALASAQLDPVLLLDAALRRIADTVGVDLAAAYLRDGERLLLVAGLGLAPASARVMAVLKVGEGAAGLAVQRLAPVVTDDAATLGARVSAVQQQERIGPAAAVPLLSKNQALGSIVVGRRGVRRGFEESEIALLSAIGVQLGVAVENARLFADVRRRLSDLEAVHALALRVFGNAPGDVRALLEDGCREAARALSARGAAVLLLAEDGQTLRGAAAFGTPLEPERLTLRLDEDGLATEAFRRRAPAWSEDVQRDPRSTLGRVPGLPPLSMLAVPLTSRAATRGVLFVADDAGRTFSDPERALANALAGELAVGLENAELYAEARRRVDELSLLNEMGRTMTASLDLDRVLRDGAEAARQLLDASRAYVVLHDTATGELRVGAGTGLGPEELALSVEALRHGDSLTARVLREGRAVVVEDVERDPSSVHAEFRERYRPRSIVAAPMLVRGEPVGALLVDESRRVRRFDDADVERVTAVAMQLAVAVENARLYAEARGRLSELSTVIEVARVVSSSLDLEEVLGAGAEHLMRTLQGCACTILLGDVRGQPLRRAASRGGPIGEERVPLERPSIAREALESHAPVAGRVAPGPGGASDAALLAVPLHVRDQPAGVALVARADPERAFTPGELSRAMAIASQLAVAVDNARLYSETRRRAEELGVLHEVGRSLVATLDIEQVLDAGVKNLARIVDCPDAYLALATEDGEHLEVRAVTGALQAALGRWLPVRPPESSLASLAFHRRTPVAIDDADDPGTGPAVRPESGARALLGLPLLVRDRNIGSAVIVDARGPRHFTPAEVERAAAVANQLAVAAENARLYEDLRRSYAELARAQRQIVQQERLAALGELSAIVAHEVRNPLGVIFNSLGSLRRMLRPSGDAKMLLDIVGEEADRLNRIVGDLLDFARPSTPQLRPEALDRVVDEAVQAALAQNPSAVELSRASDPDLPPVPLDARLMRQAVLNVAVNAVQSMPRGGRLTVRTRRDRDAAVLEIEDTGAGMDDSVRQRIFEPFFTTKASGTGLGLAVVKRIVDGHGGEVAVRSRPGAGTTFALRFPLVGPAPAGTRKEDDLA